MKLLLILLFFSTTLFAQDIKIEVNPPRPVAGETFQVFFRIYSEYGEAPAITFSPGSVEVKGKSNHGISTRTVYANGKLTVTREVTIVYDLVAAKAGTSFLRDINVQFGNKTLKHPIIAITILKEPEEQPDVFLAADVPKKELFVGEGVTVRYYLYSKTPAQNLDIKKYPKLNHFLKRFMQDPDRIERVSVDGQLFLRSQIYAAKLFPEKTGELKIDPLSLTVTYPQIRQGDPFAAFGMSRDFKTRNISSETIKVIVKPLPTPAPVGFSGLVGKHEFDLQLSQSKLIVNQPLDIKLIVSGAGALENLEAPSLLNHPGLEEFESNGDLKIAGPDMATKTFEYTFLARNNLKLPAREIVFNYFEPQTQQYVPVKVNLPEIEVAGGGASATPSAKKEVQPLDRLISKANPTPELAGPVWATVRNYKDWLPWFNAACALFTLILVLSWFIKKQAPQWSKSSISIPSEFKKGSFHLSLFTQWMTPLIQKTGKSPLTIIAESNLDEKTRTYFIDLLNSNDYKNYSPEKGKLNFKYEARYFKNLATYIENVEHETHS
jgi:hypothetical protein